MFAGCSRGHSGSSLCASALAPPRTHAHHLAHLARTRVAPTPTHTCTHLTVTTPRAHSHVRPPPTHAHTLTGTTHAAHPHTHTHHTVTPSPHAHTYDSHSHTSHTHAHTFYLGHWRTSYRPHKLFPIGLPSERVPTSPLVPRSRHRGRGII